MGNKERNTNADGREVTVEDENVLHVVDEVSVLLALCLPITGEMRF